MTTNKAHKAIIVATEEIHEFFAANFPDWDFQVPVESVDEFWKGLSDETLDSTSDVVLFLDMLFNETPQDLVEALAVLAPSDAFVGVIVYDPSLTSAIIEKSLKIAEQEGKFGHSIYPISAEDPIDSLLNALSAYEQGISYEAIDDIVPEDSIHVNEHEHQGGIKGRIGNADVDHDGIIISSTSSKGGSGKSTCALMLAAQLSASSKKAYEAGLTDRELKVCVVDMDIRDGQIGFIIQQVTPTILGVRTAPDWGPETIENNLVYSDRLGIWALLAPKSGRSAQDLSPEFYREVFNNLRYMFDVVILDTSVNYLDKLLYQVCYPESDAILFVTTLANQAVFGMTRWFNELIEEGGNGLDPNKVGIVVNQSVPDVGMDKKKLETAAQGAKIAAAIPLETAAFIAASNRNDLSSMLLHPTIGPAYYSLATKIVRNAFPLLPLVEEIGSSTSSVNKAAPAPVKSNAPTEKKRGFFKR